MTTVTINIQGQQELIRALQSMDSEVVAVVEKGLLQTAFLAQSEAQRSILKGPKTGRIYKRGKRGRTHQASAPGEPPANDTGRLASSLRSEVSAGALTASLIAGTSYAAHLEYGTTKMAARPFMRPAAEKVAPQGEKLIRDALDKILRK